MTKEEQNAKARKKYAEKRMQIYSGLGAYATHLDRTFDQWMADRVIVMEHFQKLSK
jgi:hypothetical protein